MGLVSNLTKQAPKITKLHLEQLISFYEEVVEHLSQQEIFDLALHDTSGFQSNSVHYVENRGHVRDLDTSSHRDRQLPSDRDRLGDSLHMLSLNNSGFSEDLLNSSISSSHGGPQGGFAEQHALEKSQVTSYDVFDRFVVKVGIVIHDIENIVEKHPNVVSPGLSKKLEEVKKEANGLCRMIRTLDTKNDRKLQEAESKADSMAVEVAKLQEEVQSLLAANADMFDKLVSHGHSDGIKRSNSPRRGHKGLNESGVTDIEVQLIRKTEDYTKLKQDFETLVAEKQSLLKRCSNLQHDLEDVLGSYQEVVEEKVNMQYEMLDSQKEMERRTNLKDQVTKLRQREVGYADF